LLVDLRPSHPDTPGKTVESALESAGIVLNANTVPGETRSAFNPSGIRIGTPGVTTRGFTESTCREVADLIARIVDSPEDEVTSVVHAVRQYCRFGELCGSHEIHVSEVVPHPTYGVRFRLNLVECQWAIRARDDVALVVCHFRIDVIGSRRTYLVQLALQSVATQDSGTPPQGDGPDTNPKCLENCASVPWIGFVIDHRSPLWDIRGLHSEWNKRNLKLVSIGLLI
jgi:hypothetical protein